MLFEDKFEDKKRYLFEDKKLVEKIENNPEYFNKISLAYTYISALRINNPLEYYRNSQVFPELDGTKYEDVLAYERLQDQEYYDYIKSKLQPNIKRIK